MLITIARHSARLVMMSICCLAAVPLCSGDPSDNVESQSFKFSELQSAERFLGAIQQGDFTTVKAMLDDGQDPNTRYKDLTTLNSALQAGATRQVQLDQIFVVGDKVFLKPIASTTVPRANAGATAIEMTRLLLARGADPNLANQPNGIPPLMLAAMLDKPDLVDLLLSAGADVDKVEKNGFTTLMGVAILGHAGIAQQLLDAKASLDTQNNVGQTALILGVLEENVEVVATLLASGASVTMETESGRSTVDLVFGSESEEIRVVFEEALARPIPAISSDTLDAINVSLREAKQPRSTLLEQDAGYQRFMSSVLWRLREERLLDDAVGAGLSPLHFAAQGNHAALAKELMRRGATVDRGTDGDGSTPLHFAALTCSEDVAEALLLGGATVDALNKSGATPLHMCSLAYDCDTVARLLLKNGADAAATAKNGQTPMDIARSKSRHRTRTTIDEFASGEQRGSDE